MNSGNKFSMEQKITVGTVRCTRKPLNVAYVNIFLIHNFLLLLRYFLLRCISNFNVSTSNFMSRKLQPFAKDRVKNHLYIVSSCFNSAFVIFLDICKTYTLLVRTSLKFSMFEISRNFFLY